MEGMATPEVVTVPRDKLVVAMVPAEMIPAFVLMLVTLMAPAVKELVPKLVLTLPLTVPTRAPFMKMLPPTYKLPTMPAPPPTTSAPEDTEVEAAPPATVVLPYMTALLPTTTLPPIPTPPATMRAPVLVEVEAVVLLM